MLSSELKQKAVGLANTRGCALQVIIEEALAVYLGGSQAQPVAQSYDRSGMDMESLRRVCSQAQKDMGRNQANSNQQTNSNQQVYTEGQPSMEDLKRACASAMKDSGRQ